ncbi:MAG: helix-turn-helix transcriptional regulator [Ruminococcus sp.]|nr:helix-turn-helix transcriptional regulator [Ruminococcus sp.]
MLKNLKLLRLQHKISQQQLADIIGVSQQSVNKYENHDTEPDIRTLIALSDYFNTSIDYLVGNTDINHKIEHLNKCDLNDEETAFVNDFRKLSPKEKESVKFIISNYLEKMD